MSSVTGDGEVSSVYLGMVILRMGFLHRAAFDVLFIPCTYRSEVSQRGVEEDQSRPFAAGRI